MAHSTTHTLAATSHRGLSLAMLAAAASTLWALSGAPAHAGTQVGVYVQTPVQWRAPPPPRVVAVPAARPGYVWVQGHWEQRGRRHHWVDGFWTRSRPGYAYRQPVSEQHGDRWDYRRGHWDRDGDGVANRHDRRPNNPNRY